MKKIYLIILFQFLSGCINIQHNNYKELELKMISERYSSVDHNFFEITSNNFRKDGWFYSYHPEHINYPKNCVLLSKRAPEIDIDRIIYKIECM